MSCPRFANQGCFKAEYTMNPDFPIGFKSSFNKGCSMYELGDRDTECDDMNFLGNSCRGKHSLLKISYKFFWNKIFWTWYNQNISEHCTGTDCNIGYIGDSLPEETTTEMTPQPTTQTSPQPTTRTNGSPTTTTTTSAQTTGPGTEQSTVQSTLATTLQTTVQTLVPTTASTTVSTTASTVTLSSPTMSPTNPTIVPDGPVEDNAHLLFYCIELILLVVLLI